MTQNLLANLALLSWPLVAFFLYRTLSVTQATLWTIMGGQMALPVGTIIKFELIPPFDKTTIPNLCALLGCMLAGRNRSRARIRFGLPEVLIVMFLFGPLISSELNGDPISIGDRILPGVGLYDALSAVEGAFLTLIPFFLGRRYLRSSADNTEVVRILVIGGIVYSFPMLFEVRFSPQLHYWFYGYYSSDFIQSVRGSGFRPMVFMGNGLLAAFFVMTSAVAATALWRTNARVNRLPSAGVTAFLALVLILCKSLGAALYGAVLIPMVRFAKPRFQVRVAFMVVIFALLYPTLRTLDLIPTNLILETARSISVDRAASMQYRFDNEDLLLDRASQRLLFGWGRFGRSRIYSDQDGRDISVTDGRWVLTLGQFGIFGFLAEFGLLSIGVMRAGAALKFAETGPDKILLGTLALLVSINIVDLLPNATITPLTLLLSGALLGISETWLSAKPLQRKQKLDAMAALRS